VGGRDSALVVSVADLLPHPGTKKRIEREVLLDGLEISAARVPPGEVTTVDVELQAVNDGIVVVGTVRAPWLGECRRCLKGAGGEVDAEIAGEVFERHPVEGETWPLRDATVDLTELVREAVLLGLPIAPLCDDDCAGLCPTCGIDRNEGDCDCAADEVDPRWAALSDLRLDD
jgi:uncharacterized protein